MTFKRIISWAVGLPLAVIGIGFAVANRQWVTVSLDPINRVQPFASVDMPLWVLFFAGIFLGIFIGWFVAWRGAGKHRRSARDAKIELIRAQQAYEREKRELQQQLPAIRPENVS
jgi:hypothetical protein